MISAGLEPETNERDPCADMPFSPTIKDDLRYVDKDLLEAVSKHINILPGSSSHVRRPLSLAMSLGFESVYHSEILESPPLVIPAGTWNSGDNLSPALPGFPEDSSSVFGFRSRYILRAHCFLF
jgi:hypothetical protein